MPINPEPLSPSPEIRYQLRNWHHVNCAGFGGQACTCLEQREALIAELALKDDVIAKARCIRHWHDTGRNGEGMIVSSEAVRDLWKALAKLDKISKPTEPASTSR